MIEGCPYCGEVLEIPLPEQGGPSPGELIRCATCERTFSLQWGDKLRQNSQSGLDGALKRLFFQLGDMVTGFVSAVLMLMTLIFWAFMMFLLGWVFGDDVFAVVNLVFS
ncbi:MAG: hypothetical protein OXC95_06440 [Dehalococcoidia bacterium]|nr:hypothetical protein [Dehalococcoidia bacterium]